MSDVWENMTENTEKGNRVTQRSLSTVSDRLVWDSDRGSSLSFDICFPALGHAAAVNCGSTWSGTHFEVIRQEELGGSQEVEYVAEHVPVPIDEVVLL